MGLDLGFNSFLGQHIIMMTALIWTDVLSEARYLEGLDVFGWHGACSHHTGLKGGGRVRVKVMIAVTVGCRVRIWEVTSEGYVK